MGGRVVYHRDKAAEGYSELPPACIHAETPSGCVESLLGAAALALLFCTQLLMNTVAAYLLAQLATEPVENMPPPPAEQAASAEAIW